MGCESNMDCNGGDCDRCGYNQDADDDDGLRGVRGVFWWSLVGAAFWVLVALAVWCVCGCASVPAGAPPPVEYVR